MNWDFLNDIPGSIKKPEPRVVTKKRREKLDQRNERACREIVKKRDKGKCRIPGCINRENVEMHHIVPRSRSSKLKWHTGNNLLLCVTHHRLRHAGVISITGDADGEILVTGDVDRLRFRL